MKVFGPKVLESLTKLWMPVGKRVVIIGGGIEGCQLAEFLVKRGRKVTIVETAQALGKGLLSDDPDRLFKWFNKKGTVIMSQVTCEEITDEGLIISTKDGEKKTLQADSIITALPLQPAGILAENSLKKVPEVYQIGDCREPGYMHDAIADGYRIGCMI